MNKEELKAWRQARKSGIGGSDAAAVCGDSKWKTPRDVYFDKTSHEIEVLNSIAVRHGTHCEPLIKQLYEEHTGNLVEPLDMVIKDGFLIANVDGIVPHKKMIVEFKTASIATDWGEEGTDEIPLTYKYQVAHYLHVLDYDVAQIAVLFRGNQFRLYEYKRDLDFEKAMVEKETHFWNEYVKTKHPPPPCSFEELQRHWNFEVNNGEKEASFNALKALADYEDVKAKMQELREKEQEIKIIIMNEMQEKTQLKNDGKTLATWKMQKRKSLDTKLIKENYEDIAKIATTETESRVLRIKGL